MRLAILLLPVIAVVLFGQGKQVGYVLAAQGQWKWDSKASSTLSPGDPVNERVMARAVDQKATLTIAMLDGTVKSFACCVASIGAFRPPPDSLYTRLLTVGKTFFTQRNAMPVYAISRGASAQEFQHAVLVLDDGRLEIGPAITDLESGTYALRLRSLEKSTTGYTANFTWGPPGSTFAIFPDLKLGVYELIFTSTEGMRLGSTPVLVSVPAEAAAKQSALEDGKRITRAWPRATDPAATYNFLTAFLIDIAQQVR